jgi:hypothetical protein
MRRTSMHNTLPQDDDLMIGAQPIAQFVYGNTSPRSMRSVYANPLGLSLFKHGGFIAGRKSTIQRELGLIEAEARKAASAGAA